MARKLMAMLIAVLLTVSMHAWAADDGATLYKGKCAGCHGANGEGKPAIKAPPIKGTNLEVDQIVERVTRESQTVRPLTTRASAD